VEIDGRSFLITGPYAHENVEVFLLHSAEQDDRDFVTLDDGLREGTVRISEQQQERVNALEIENDGDQALYLQEGERLRGGKQDRVIIASLIVPPHSGRMSLPTFCVEQSRWSEGTSGRGFGITESLALAPKGVRGAAKVDGSQSGVWSCVGTQKRSASKQLNTPNRTSSINETLDSPEAARHLQSYAEALSAVLPHHPDAIGVAVLINGEIEEVNLYPNHGVLSKLYPRLINSYAFQALLLNGKAQDVAPESAATIARFIREGAEKSRQERDIDARNRLAVSVLEGDKYLCKSEYENRVIHWQLLRRNGLAAGAGARCEVLGSDW
jgi:hypothetical protein